MHGKKELKESLIKTNQTKISLLVNEFILQGKIETISLEFVRNKLFP